MMPIVAHHMKLCCMVHYYPVVLKPLQTPGGCGIAPLQGLLGHLLQLLMWKILLLLMVKAPHVSHDLL